MLETINDLAMGLDAGYEIDILFLDFSKAFERVSHTCLLYTNCYITESAVLYIIKRYGSTVKVGVVVKISQAAQNSAFKNHPRDILHDENHIYRLVLVHIIHNTALNITKHLQVAGYRILENRQTQTLVSLPHRPQSQG